MSNGDQDLDDANLLGLFRAIASADHGTVTRIIEDSPGLATKPRTSGATRQEPSASFLTPIHHHTYAGDTALHIAAAAHDRDVARSLVARGADVRARNRRGAEPLHYAADGAPGAAYWDPEAQGELIAYLIDAGADPDAMDKSGVAPLHRAVRTRSSTAVRVLISKGADPLLMNKSGSTPLHLAVQTTGKSNSGTDAAKEEQRRIIAILREYGASPDDRDAKGRSVAAAASSEWIRELLQ